MKLIAIALITIFMAPSLASAQSYSHNYESFFGKDDRIGLYSETADDLFPAKALQSIRQNTLLIDCGSQSKPSTAFITNNKIVSAAHNLILAQTQKQKCKIGTVDLPEGQPSINFKNANTKEDAAHDVASWPNITPHKGFKICKTINTSAQYVLVQSMDGTGRLGISPFCKIKSVEKNLIITTCRGHYKASGAPLLTVTTNNVCVAGVFNAHNGRLFKYESYAARLAP